MRKGIALLVLGLILSIPALGQNAQQAPGGDKISLQEAIDIALENNYQIKVARNNVNLSQKQVLSEKADYLPSVNANLSGSKSIGRTFSQDLGQIVTQTTNSFGGRVSADLPIFSGFENLNSLKSSQFSEQSEKENLESVREQIIFTTVSNYLQFILDQKVLEIDRENLEASRKTLEQVKAQVEVGSRPRVDLYDQESQVASDELAVVNSENQLQSSRLTLIQTLQIDPRQDYDFVTPEIDTQSVRATSYDLDQLVNTALENRSDLKSEKFNIQSIKHQLNATKASLYPSLSFSASLGSRYSDGIPVNFQDQFFDQNIQRSYGLSLSIPIFSNLGIRTNVESQEIQYKNAKLNLRNTELQVIQDVNTAFNDYRSYVQQLESSEKALQAAERAYQTQKQRYEVGAGTLIELSDANARYVEAQSSRAQSLFRVIFQQQILEYQIGKLDQNVSLN
jgi:outer membrane protein